jgi:hypothetical protein
MAEEVHGAWATYTVWAIIERTDVHDVLGPPLPGEDISGPGDAATDDRTRRPSRGLATGRSLLGLWIDQ